MTEWFVVSFDQATEDGFRTVKVTAPNDDEAIRQAGAGFNVAFLVKEDSVYKRPFHAQLVDDTNNSRLLQKRDHVIPPYQMDAGVKTASDKSV